MNRINSRLHHRLLFGALLAWTMAAWADSYSDAISLFKNAGQSAAYFHDSVGYAVFPTIGKGGIGVGAAHGSGRLYEHGIYVGDASMNQVSVGW